MDWEAEGLLEGLETKEREARRELLDHLHGEGCSIEDLRSAVEEAFEPATSTDDASASMSAGMSATLPAPPEPEEPAAPRTVALPEPEGLPRQDSDEEVVAPVEGATTVRLVGLAGGVTSGPRSPVVRVAA